MGHSSIAITVDLYGHLIPGGNRQAFDRLDEGISPGEWVDLQPPRNRRVRRNSVGWVSL